VIRAAHTLQASITFFEVVMEFSATEICQNGPDSGMHYAGRYRFALQGAVPAQGCFLAFDCSSLSHCACIISSRPVWTCCHLLASWHLSLLSVQRLRHLTVFFFTHLSLQFLLMDARGAKLRQRLTSLKVASSW
jgi:hypothetical protein